MATNAGWAVPSNHKLGHFFDDEGSSLCGEFTLPALAPRTLTSSVLDDYDCPLCAKMLPRWMAERKLGPAVGKKKKGR